MATTFYLRNLKSGVFNYDQMRLERGAASTTLTINTSANSTYVSGKIWATKPLVGFTLSGSISVRVRAVESATQANSGIRVIVYKWNYDNGLSSALLTLSQGTELGTTEADVDLTGTPTSTTFANGDVLVVEVGITNVGGNMGGGRTVDVTYNGATGSAAGDAYITINENVTLHRRFRNTG